MYNTIKPETFAGDNFHKLAKNIAFCREKFCRLPIRNVDWALLCKKYLCGRQQYSKICKKNYPRKFQAILYISCVLCVEQFVHIHSHTGMLKLLVRECADTQQ